MENLTSPFGSIDLPFTNAHMLTKLRCGFGASEIVRLVYMHVDRHAAIDNGWRLRSTRTRKKLNKQVGAVVGA